MTRYARLLAVTASAAVIIALGCVPALAARQKANVAEPAPVIEKRSVLVFPIGKEPEVTGGPAALPAMVWDAVRSWLNKTGTYEAVSPDPSSPTLQRAVREQRIKQEELTQLPYSQETATKIVREFGDVIVVVGSVLEYKYDTSANRAEVSVSLEVVDTRTGARRTIGVSGLSKPQPTLGTEEALAAEAAQDAGLKLAAQIAGVTPEALTQRSTQALSPAKEEAPKAKRSSKISRGLWFVLGAIIMGLVANSGGDGGAASTPTIPVTPPAVPF
ncbi:MAG: hypothetical protein ACUVRO_10825 [Armatimonadota bacterium]